MDELLQLSGLVADDKKIEAQKYVDAINALFKANDNKVNEQERLKLDAIKTRDEMKTKLKEIASKLGATDVENINDAIEAIKTKTGVKETEALELKNKEIENLKAEIAQINEQKAQLEQNTQAELRDIILERDLALVLPKYKAREELSKYLIEDIKKQASFEDGKLLFKNEDGTTLRLDGKDATLEDIIKNRKEQEAKEGKSIFFDNTVQQSGVTTTGGSTTDDDDFYFKD